MMRLALLVLVGLCTSSCQVPPVRPPEMSKPYHLVDLTGDYRAFFDRTQGMDAPARTTAFKTAFAPLFPGFYDPERVKAFASRERYDAMIAASFDTFPALRIRFDATATAFVSMLTPAQDDFRRHFPDFRALGNVYLVHSLGEMDGGTRTIDGTRYLVFGADVMARLYAPGDERPFVQHEVFHVYHDQFFTGCGEVWCALWREGLAVYVSEQLNPGATDAQLGLAAPRPIRAEVDADRATAVCAVRARLRSERREDYASMFFGQTGLDGMPPRFGYYVGYLVAREAARTHSLQALAHLTPAVAQPVVENALAALAECPIRP